MMVELDFPKRVLLAALKKYWPPIAWGVNFTNRTHVSIGDVTIANIRMRQVSIFV